MFVKIVNLINITKEMLRSVLMNVNIKIQHYQILKYAKFYQIAMNIVIVHNKLKILIIINVLQAVMQTNLFKIIFVSQIVVIYLLMKTNNFVLNHAKV